METLSRISLWAKTPLSWWSQTLFCFCLLHKRLFGGRICLYLEDKLHISERQISYLLSVWKKDYTWNVSLGITACYHFKQSNLRNLKIVTVDKLSKQFYQWHYNVVACCSKIRTFTGSFGKNVDNLHICTILVREKHWKNQTSGSVFRRTKLKNSRCFEYSIVLFIYWNDSLDLNIIFRKI